MESFFPHSKVAVWGLGLMGGSLALALRGQVAAIYGIDRDPQAVRLAQQKKIVELASCEPGELLPLADVIILAVPVRTIIRLIGEIPVLNPGRALVLDLGSTKVEIMAAMQSLPQRFDVLGGHPMCGKEQGGLENAEAGLFRGASFAFTPLERTSDAVKKWAVELAITVAARPLWLDAATHDRWAAAVSHLPYLASNLLAAGTDPEVAPLVGSGFRSAARLAPTPGEMMLDILATNKGNLLPGLQAYRERLDHLITMLESGDEASLMTFLQEGAQRYTQIIRNSSVEKS